MPSPKIEHWNTAVDGPLCADAFRRKLQGRGYACSIYRYPPGTRFPEHLHDQDKIDGVLQGRFRIGIGGQSFVLGPGDCLAVPRGTLHDAEVVGGDTVVSIDAVAG